MYLSLYRKFRPARFEEIVRQEHIVRILTSQIEKNAVGHAYLFTGPRGTGKTTTARIFARAVNCEHPQNGSPCGVCATCRALAEGSLDISEIDAASNNGVGEMRELREKVQYPPVSGRYKVYIIDEVHMLTDSAFNALLKTLEEPPVHAIFILATTEPQKVPATILSRCMRLDFKLIPEEDLEKHLRGILDAIGKPYEEEAVAAIARAGAGSDRDMLSIAEACIVYSEKLTYDAVCAVLGAADFGRTAELVEAMLASDMPSAISRTEQILAEGKSVGVLLKDILDLLGKLTVVKTCKSADKILALPEHLFRRVKQIADGADGRAILRATEIMIGTESDLRFVSSPRISLEAAILRAATPSADFDPEALMVRIDALERKLRELELRPAPQPPTSATPLSEGAPISHPDADPTPLSEAAPAPHPEANSIPHPEAGSARHPEGASPSGPYDDGYEFPTEEPIFEEAYYADEPAPVRAPQAPKSKASAKERAPMSASEASESGRTPSPEDAPAPHPEASKKPSGSVPPEEDPDPFTASAPHPEAAPAPHPEALKKPSGPSVVQDADRVYALFMRELRKTSKSGVLFTMCYDLTPSFEGSKLILSTTSQTIVSVLGREAHQKAMAEVLAGLGVREFEVRLAEKAPQTRDAIEELKANFKDYPIEIK